jgi:hypothetical protein
MRKLKLLGLKKGKSHSVFHIEKDEIFLQKFRNFLHNLGFDKNITANELLKLLGDVDNNYSMKKYSNELYQDKYFYFENENYRIDLFFGKEKITVSIFTSLDDQQIITKLITDFCE